MLVRTSLAAIVAAIALVASGVAPAQAAQPRFTPKQGVTFNSPVGNSDAQRRIKAKIVKSIKATPRGANIDIFTWNFMSSEGTRALLAAQKRGVRVRLLMARSNLTEIDNPPFKRLRAGLKAGNKGRRDARKSFAKVCQGTCRAKGGAAHSKFFLFSKVGKARNVYMQGSANFTNAAAWNQWNDIYTHVGNEAIYKWALARFNEAVADKPLKRPYAHKKFGSTELIMFPNTGARTTDPVMDLLNKVKCRGATNTASRRTVIRVAPDVMRNDRGMKLARKLRGLWQSGCQVRIGYTVMGIDIGRYLREETGRGPVPMRHLASDVDLDGDFDTYFHLKAMTIVGNVAGKRANHVVLNGSANWSGLAKVSDENLGIYWNKRLTLRYQEHLDYWYDNFALRATNNTNPTNPPTPALRRGVDEDRLVFGSGRNAIYEDGEKVSKDGSDPFAQVDMD